MKSIEIILVDWNSEKSIKLAENKKAKLENKGYNLVSSTENKLVYKIE